MKNIKGIQDFYQNLHQSCHLHEMNDGGGFKESKSNPLFNVKGLENIIF